MAVAPSRFLIAKEKISFSENDHVLEIGCGNGTLIHEISKELSSGIIIGIDKSKSAIDKATAKNKACLLDKKVILINTELQHARLSKKQFNKVVSFNVNIFLKNSELEFRMLKEILKPKGEILVFYQFPFKIDIEAANPIVENFVQNGFKVTHRELLPASPVEIVYVKAVSLG
jgi:cyclopropane fatty-acyl-phospholipid synthase-like methyltransferase